MGLANELPDEKNLNQKAPIDSDPTSLTDQAAFSFSIPKYLISTKFDRNSYSNI
jgi:hypothetical protein